MVGTYGLALAAFFPFTAEDAFIVARYAENFVDRGELVFNAGERIAAFTSPLHTLLSSILYAVSGATLPANKVVSIFMVLLALLLAVWRLRFDWNLALIFLAVVLPSPFVVLWSTGGLETPYLLSLVTMCTLALRGRVRDWSPYRASLLSVLMALTILTRFDAVLFVLPAAAYLAWEGRRRPRLLMALLTGVVVIVIWLVFARMYYGAVLPTSFYLKTPSANRWVLQKNAIYLAEFAALSGVLPAFLPLLSALRRAPHPWRVVGETLRSRPWLWVSLTFVLLYGLTAASTHMMFAHRLLVPFLPAILLAGFEPMAGPGTLLASCIPRHRPAFLPAVAAGTVVFQAALGFIVYGVSLNPSFVGEYARESSRGYTRSFLGTLALQADEVRADWERRPGSKVRRPRIVTFAAGALPYRYRDAYVYEQLVSFRFHCEYDCRRSADYVHILVPRHGTVDAQLAGTVGALELVSDHAIEFDGRQERFQVFFQSHAEENHLPPGIREACLDSVTLPGGITGTRDAQPQDPNHARSLRSRGQSKRR
jgi:hypothetical protein